MAGYSGTPLPQKLGIKAGSRVALVGSPDGFDEVLGSLPAGVSVSRRATGRFDVIVAFFRRRSEFERKLPALTAALETDGGLWVAWPKKASGVATDMNEHVMREVALPTGLVDNKVCAIDDTWTGMRLVIRRELRPGRASTTVRP